ncbi:DUF4920 domain-containing protein [Alteromonas sp. ASW11-36]|uniref:DUF4920 domain-containing protein n=1 Tax=Alteromonas arenosi TaxID=3055817 RepID=A0ABT7SZK2_9ALTE|nr:DUF4920 domain-containing protein [Alteromonas sp. ASW11-36]MDM7861601.1 DUF4920 domain-containing protein [Alteromonas sp. ASW11-36]
MRRITLLALLAFSALTYAQTLRLSEPVATTSTTETFGAVIDETVTDVALAQLLEAPTDYLGEPVKVNTRISKVCQKKGCFFIAQQEEHVIRVSFRDYGFFVPTDISGKQVTLVGELIKQQISEAQADHINSDLAGTEAVITAGVQYELVADAVRVPK